MQPLEQRRRAGNLRTLQLPSVGVDFASNDYLGLARCPKLAIAAELEWEQSGMGLGATGSRLLTGNSAYAEQLEREIAQYHQAETALLFGCGYLANLGLFSALALERKPILFDAGIHASVRDGLRLGGARAVPVRHNDLNHLEGRLRALQEPSYIAVESVYSTDGQLAPLAELNSLAEKYGAQLIVDEAHAVGILGTNLCTPFARLVTFGKALGGYGAAVLGSETLKSMLLNFARSVIYSTALPPFCLATIRCGYRMLPSLEPERRHLQLLIRQFGRSPSPIQPVPVPGNQAVRAAALAIREAGLDVRPLMSPTVRRGEEMLRVCLHAFNTTDELKRLEACIASL
jgi:8-amino-7-oxononanoate synthase